MMWSTGSSVARVPDMNPVIELIEAGHVMVQPVNPKGVPTGPEVCKKTGDVWPCQEIRQARSRANTARVLPKLLNSPTAFPGLR